MGADERHRLHKHPRRAAAGVVDAAQHVAGTGLGVPDLDVADQSDQLAKPPLVNHRPGVVSRQHVLERGVVALKRDHRLIDGQADSRLPRLRPQMRPTGLGRHPEHVLGDVLVPVLGSVLAPFGQHRGTAFLEGVGDVLEEDQSEDDVLVLGGVHRDAQSVGPSPAPPLSQESDWLADTQVRRQLGVTSPLVKNCTLRR